MQLLPSLLEYTKEDIQIKIDKIFDSKQKFLEITNQNSNLLALHLDFVLPEFAANRGVKTGVNFLETLEAVKNSTAKYPDQKLDLSVHFMGEDGDMQEVFKELERSTFPENWQIVVFVSVKYFKDWQKFNSKNIQIGYWYDWEEWQIQTFSEFDSNSPKNVLLMTVKAGKSGQKRTPESVQMVFESSEKFPDINFICDGGWQVEDLKSKISNLDMVSYSSFWKSF